MPTQRQQTADGFIREGEHLHTQVSYDDKPQSRQEPCEDDKLDA